MTAVDGALTLWFAMAALSVLFVVQDLVTRTPAMAVMKWGWALVVLYTGPVGLFVYLISCREPLPGTHRQYVAPLWKQAVGSTIHCVAGDATGVLVGALVALALRLPRALDLVLEYAMGFAFGLLIFQALFTKIMSGGSYAAAVRKTLLPEWISMNVLMGGMIPAMVILMSRDARAMEPTGLRFWGVMSASILVGSLVAYPVNVWLVARGLKHGMGTARVLGRGGHAAEREGHQTRRPAGRAETLLVTLASLAALAAGVFAAARFGGFRASPQPDAYRLASRSSISAFISPISRRWASMMPSASFRTRGSEM